jgi:hypothetical protein
MVRMIVPEASIGFFHLFLALEDEWEFFLEVADYEVVLAATGSFEG